jgi:hypothetical protein
MIARTFMHIDRAEIVAMLRSRGQDARADWVEGQLPPIVDTYSNAGLLSTLDIDPTVMTAVDAPVEPAARHG